MKELWKDIPGYEGLYRVSNMGRVYSQRAGRCLKGGTTGAGRKMVVLYGGGGGTKCALVHRLVANAFITNPENKPEVHHIDHDPQNNRADNLVWVTKIENYSAYMQSAKFEQAKEKLKPILARGLKTRQERAETKKQTKERATK